MGFIRYYLAYYLVNLKLSFINLGVESSKL
jgi:hypothetical protein